MVVSGHRGHVGVKLGTADRPFASPLEMYLRISWSRYARADFGERSGEQCGEKAGMSDSVNLAGAASR